MSLCLFEMRSTHGWRTSMRLAVLYLIQAVYCQLTRICEADFLMYYYSMRWGLTISGTYQTSGSNERQHSAGVYTNLPLGSATYFHPRNRIVAKGPC